MSDPSLLNIPYRFKPSKLYSQIPDSGLGDFVVSRSASNAATRVNAQGFIETVADNIPRLDYPLGGIANGCPALLVEPQAQNVVVQSQNWLASGWRSDAGGDVTTVTGTSGTLDPLGTNTANAISPTSGSAVHLKVGNDGSGSFTSGTIYTESGFFKQGVGDAGRYVQLTYPSQRFTQNGYANFDLQLGTVAVVSGTSADTNRAAGIENYGNGWYRCRFTATCNNTGTGNGFTAVLITATGSTRAPSFSGTTTDILYGWGAQTETGSVATSYIPTTTAAVTRNADVISVSGAVSGCVGQTEGTIYAEVDIRNMAKETYILEIDDGVNANRVLLRSLTDNKMRGSIVATTSSGTIGISSATFNAGIIKIAFAYKSGDFALSVNGATALTASGTFTFGASLNRVTLGSVGGGGSQLNDRIRAVALYTTRLTNSELAALTT